MLRWGPWGWILRSVDGEQRDAVPEAKDAEIAARVRIRIRRQALITRSARPGPHPAVPGRDADRRADRFAPVDWDVFAAAVRSGTFDS